MENPLKLLLAMSPTILLVVYSQLATKWRVTHMTDESLAPGANTISRIHDYLHDPIIVSAYLASFLASIAWIFVVEKYELSNAFPVYIGLTVLLVTVGSALLFKETINPQRIASILLIICGVAIGSRS